VDHVLGRALDPVLAARSSATGLRVLDPACGDGRFLAAAAERVERRFGAVPPGCLVGVDVDPGATAVARARLGPVADIVTADALAGGWPDGSFDVVVGNPPFLNQLAGATRRRVRSALGGPYADSAALFLAQALRAVRPDGGRVGFVLPHSLLATRDTAPIRIAVVTGGRLDSLWWAGAPVFDAEVLTCAVTCVRGEPQGDVRRTHGAAFVAVPPADGRDLTRRPTWSHLVADVVGIPPVDLAGGRPLGDLAEATADFRDQYYGLVPHVDDGADGPPLVTSGLIDPGVCAWGGVPARFGRRRFEAPRVAVDRLPPPLADWAVRRLVPKVLVATQTPVIEAAVDADGAWLPSVPVLTVTPRRPDDLWRIGAVLCAPAASAWAAATYLGAALTATGIKLSASQVLTLPLPPVDDWPEAVDALRAGDVHGCARHMDAAYGTDVYDWWRTRLTRRSR
jgi:SAM-dependent methyltransferase